MKKLLLVIALVVMLFGLGAASMAQPETYVIDIVPPPGDNWHYFCNDQYACWWWRKFIIDWPPVDNLLRVRSCATFLGIAYNCQERWMVFNYQYSEDWDWPAAKWESPCINTSNCVVLTTDSPYYKMLQTNPPGYWSNAHRQFIGPLLAPWNEQQSAYPAPMMGEKQIEPTAPAKAKKTKVPAYP